MPWRIEDKHFGKGHDIEGNFDVAVRDAQGQCTTDAWRWVVRMLPGIVHVAEVTLRGCLWTKSELAGNEVVGLVRQDTMTIEGLAFLGGRHPIARAAGP